LDLARISTLSVGAGTRGTVAHDANGLVGTQFSQPGGVRTYVDNAAMALVRPPRLAVAALTDRVRGAILAEYHRLSQPASALLATHVRAEHLAHARDLLADVEERYQTPTGSLLNGVRERMFGSTVWQHPSLGGMAEQHVFSDNGARHILLELPDAEFLTVLEHAAGDSPPPYVSNSTAADLLCFADDALQTHGCPFRLDRGDWPHFDWIGDSAHHELVVEPALRALADTRLAGARAEFEEALSKRRDGTPKDLEDAVDEAAKSVESILKVLHDELGVTPPRSQQVTPLFNSLVTANAIPSYVDKLIAAASGPRNNMASHGQGATVREVPEELADASIAAAATAITLLAHYLP